jgi:hypothetical protein
VVRAGLYSPAVIEIPMLQPENHLRLACGAATLFATLGLCWVFEAVLGSPANSMLGSCCAGWHSAQYLPYVFAGYTTGPAETLSLPIFWLLFTLQWFLFGTLVVSRIVSYCRRIADLLQKEPDPFPERHAIIIS